VTEPLLQVRNLRKVFPITKGVFARKVGEVRAVHDVSFDIMPGETLSLVGESGCGKTTTGRAILRLIEPTSGEVKFAGRDVLSMNASELRALRREMQIIFQDPYGSLNPRMTVGAMIEEPLRLHGLHPGTEKTRVHELLGLVGLAPDHARRYPHEFSGGQRQRIAIARTMILKPKVVVLDEPTSGLDPISASDFDALISTLQQTLGLTVFMVTHDLDSLNTVCDRVAALSGGKIVEVGPIEQLVSSQHPWVRSYFHNARARTRAPASH